MNKKIIAAALLVGAISLPLPPVDAQPSEVPSEAPSDVSTQAVDEWYWLASDNKYSKYFDPSSVKVLKSSKREDGREIATQIEAWTKTTYSYDGAAETIDNYEIKSLLPDPSKLSYSLALLKINPQNRTIQYAREDFYDRSGKVIWSKAEGRIKEINSQSFDEDFYCAIVDEVFKQGEYDRKNASDRWIDLCKIINRDGSITTITADTTTMRLKGSNLIVWQWQDTRDATGNVTEIRFMKKAVNLAQGTERITNGEMWTPHHGWQELEDENDGAYVMINGDAPEYKGLVRLRAFAKGYPAWVNRYAIE